MVVSDQLIARRIVSFISVVLVTSLLASSSYGFNAKKKFKRKCSSCHTIGGGDLVGPDLKGITSRRSEQWLIKFIQSSADLIASGDEDAIAIFKQYNEMAMPDQKFTDQEVKYLLQFIDGAQADAGASAQTIKSADSASETEVTKGKDLFLGNIRLAKGGPQCISCHAAGDVGTLGGGGLGPDLTKIYSKMGDAGISGALTNISFPTMVGPYKGKELTKDEVFQLKAFFASVDKQGLDENKNYALKFAFLGAIGFLVLLGIFHLLWGNRRTKTRRPKF